MELGLSLGDATKPFTFAEKPRHRRVSAKDFGFCMGLSIGSAPVTGEKETGEEEEEEEEEEYENGEDNQLCREEEDSLPVSIDGPVQLDLLPHTPVPRIPPSTVQIFHWHPREDGSSEAGSSTRGLDVNRIPSTEAVDGDASPPYDAAISLPTYTGGGDGAGNERGQVDRASSRPSDDDESGPSRKKLRLSKEQSAFLEESFKEHNTLNPKQKLAVANQLNLRPRQVEVWFQNRRARTKLRQTEVDCEYLKKCCETLTVENRRLQKELQELKALKSNNSLYMQSPATTLNMCPSCERVATSSTAAAAAVSTAGASKPCTEPTIKASSGLSFSKSRSYPFGPHQSPASH